MDFSETFLFWTNAGNYWENIQLFLYAYSSILLKSPNKSLMTRHFLNILHPSTASHLMIFFPAATIIICHQYGETLRGFFQLGCNGCHIKVTLYVAVRQDTVYHWSLIWRCMPEPIIPLDGPQLGYIGKTYDRPSDRVPRAHKRACINHVWGVWDRLSKHNGTCLGHASYTGQLLTRRIEPDRWLDPLA